MAEQLNYNPEFGSAEYRPYRAPDRTRGMEENEARFRNADAAIVAQMRQDQSVIAANERQRAENMKALAGFSKTLSQEVSKAAYRWADNEMLEADMDSMEQGATPITYGDTNDDAERAEVRQLGAIGDAALKQDEDNADIVVPTISRSIFYQRRREQNRLRMSVATDMRQFVDDAIAASGATDGATVAAVTAEATKQFMGLLNIDRNLVGGKFLQESLFPEIQRQRLGALGDARKSVAIEQSVYLQNDAWATLRNDKDIATFLQTAASTVDSNGKRLGFGGAWKLFESRLAEAIETGNISQTEIQEMRNQKIPKDPKGRTYGELYDAKFDAAETAARKQRLADYSLSQQEKTMAFKEEEQKLMDAFSGVDADGYTDEQIENAIDKLEAAYPGMEASGLRRMLNTTVDAKTREKQTEQIEDLMALGLLTPERLRKFDRKLWSKYMSTAQQQAKQAQDSGQYKAYLDEIKAQVEKGPKDSPLVGPGKNGVFIVTARMKEYFLRAAEKYGREDPATAGQRAYDDTMKHFNDSYRNRVDPNGYTGITADAQEVARQRIINNERLIEIDEAMRQEGFLDKPFSLFDQAQMEEMSRGYGKPGWTPSPALVYIANKQGIDPLTVLNRQRIAAGMTPLPTTPASEVITNELTPAQRAALANIGTTQVSTRVMGSLGGGSGGFRPELVKGGFGELVVQSASKNGVKPNYIAALLEIESGGNPNARNRDDIGLMQINTYYHPGYKGGTNPAANIEYGTQHYAKLLKKYGDPVKAAGAYNAGETAFDDYLYRGIPLEPVTVKHMKRFSEALYKYGGGQQALNAPTNLRPVYVTGNIGPTSTGPHLDVKQVGRGEFAPNALDNYVEVEDKELGRVPLGRVPITGDFASHTRRGSHGIDYGTYSGSKVYLKNGARVVSTTPSVHGDVLLIQLPNGKQYTFLHGTSNK